MEKTLDLTHLLNEDHQILPQDSINIIFYEFDPGWNYSFNVHDAGLNLTINQD